VRLAREGLIAAARHVQFDAAAALKVLLRYAGKDMLTGICLALTNGGKHSERQWCQSQKAKEWGHDLRRLTWS